MEPTSGRTLAIVTFDFHSGVAGELSLQVMDVVEVLKKVDVNWSLGLTEDGRRGRYPNNFTQTVTSPPLQPGQALFLATADFFGGHPGDLTFSRGQVIKGLRPVDQYWWEGTAGGPSQGIFPLTHVKQIFNDVMPAPDSQANASESQTKYNQTYLSASPKLVPHVVDEASSQGHSQIDTDGISNHMKIPMSSMQSIKGELNACLFTAVAIVDATAQIVGELGFKAGDTISVLRVIDEDWYEGCCHGNTGIFFRSLVDDQGQGETYDREHGRFPQSNLSPPGNGHPSEGSRLHVHARDRQPINVSLPSPGIFSTDSDSFTIHHVSGLSSGYPGVSHSSPSEVSLSSASVLSHSNVSGVPSNSNSREAVASSSCLTVPSTPPPAEAVVPSPSAKAVVPSPSAEAVVPSPSEPMPVALPSQLAGVDLVNTSAHSPSLSDGFHGDSHLVGPVCQHGSHRADSLDQSCESVTDSAYGSTREQSIRTGVPTNFKERKGSGITMTEPRGRPSSDPMIGQYRVTAALQAEDRARPASYGGDGRTKEAGNSQGPPEEGEHHNTVPGISLKDNVDGQSTVESDSNQTSGGTVTKNNKPTSKPRRDRGERSTYLGDSAEKRPVSVASTISTGSCDTSQPPLDEYQLEAVRHRVAELQQDIDRYRSDLDQANKAEEEDDTLAFYVDNINGMMLELHELSKSLEKQDRRHAAIPTSPSEEAAALQLLSSHGLTQEEEENLLNSTINSEAEEVALPVARKGRDRARDTRQRVIAEILETEESFHDDLALCYQVFLGSDSVSSPDGFDLELIFGNLSEVIELSSRLAQQLRSIVDDEDVRIGDRIIGRPFVELAQSMKEVYAPYCRNHDESSAILEKHYTAEGPLGDQVRAFVDEGVNKMREVTNVFTLGSVLIKPVQRVLKYALLLGELEKVTDPSHPDKTTVAHALEAMRKLGADINEYKRRKDLVYRYRGDHQQDTSLLGKMTKINIRSIRKKSKRLGMRVTTAFGSSSASNGPAAVTSEVFVKAEEEFRDLAKMARHLMKNVVSFIEQVERCKSYEEVMAGRFADLFERAPPALKFALDTRGGLRTTTSRLKQSLDLRVISPLQKILNLFCGPENVIQKRYDKLLDFESARQKVGRTRDIDKAKGAREEFEIARKNYEALNVQLVFELPEFNCLVSGLLKDVIQQFLSYYATFTGEYLTQVVPYWTDVSEPRPPAVYDPNPMRVQDTGFQRAGLDNSLRY